MIIELTLFKPPMGRQEQLYKEIPDRYREKWSLIQSLGCRLTVEHLRFTDQGSMCIEHPQLGDVDGFLLPIDTDPSVVDERLYKMLDDFSAEKFEVWKKSME